MADKFTFTNTGEQQCVIIYIEYHYGDETGVNTVNEFKTANSDAIYNLAGQKVDSNYRGIVIKNGKKFLY